MNTVRLNEALTDIIRADSPDGYAAAVARMLDLLAEDCHGAAHECNANWQSTTAGEPWTRLAKALDATVRKLERMPGRT